MNKKYNLHELETLIKEVKNIEDFMSKNNDINIEDSIYFFKRTLEIKENVIDLLSTVKQGHKELEDKAEESNTLPKNFINFI